MKSQTNKGLEKQQPTQVQHEEKKEKFIKDTDKIIQEIHHLLDEIKQKKEELRKKNII